MSNKAQQRGSPRRKGTFRNKSKVQLQQEIMYFEEEGSTSQPHIVAKETTYQMYSMKTLQSDVRSDEQQIPNDDDDDIYISLPGNQSGAVLTTTKLAASKNTRSYEKPALQESSTTKSPRQSKTTNQSHNWVAIGEAQGGREYNLHRKHSPGQITAVDNQELILNDEEKDVSRHLQVNGLLSDFKRASIAATLMAKGYDEKVAIDASKRYNNVKMAQEEAERTTRWFGKGASTIPSVSQNKESYITPEDRGTKGGSHNQYNELFRKKTANIQKEMSRTHRHIRDQTEIEQTHSMKGQWQCKSCTSWNGCGYYVCRICGESNDNLRPTTSTKECDKNNCEKKVEDNHSDQWLRQYWWWPLAGGLGTKERRYNQSDEQFQEKAMNFEKVGHKSQPYHQDLQSDGIKSNDEENFSSGRWQCKHCTSWNAYGHYVCRICGKSNYNLGPTIPAKRYNENDFEKKKEGNHSDQWQCQYCTSWNVVVTYRCTVCFKTNDDLYERHKQQLAVGDDDDNIFNSVPSKHTGAVRKDTKAAAPTIVTFYEKSTLQGISCPTATKSQKQRENANQSSMPAALESQELISNDEEKSLQANGLQTNAERAKKAARSIANAYDEKATINASKKYDNVKMAQEEPEQLRTGWFSKIKTMLSSPPHKDESYKPPEDIGGTGDNVGFHYLASAQPEKKIGGRPQPHLADDKNNGQIYLTKALESANIESDKEKEFFTEEWQCNYCTSWNGCDHYVCRICGKSNDNLRPIIPAEKCDENDFEKKVKDNHSDEWQCKYCTSWNNEFNYRCTVCFKTDDELYDLHKSHANFDEFLRLEEDDE